jgi:hypothetical protein
MRIYSEELLDAPMDRPASTPRCPERGHRVVSCDPLYRLCTDQINLPIRATYEEVIRQTRQNEEKFVWDRIRSLEELSRLRLEAMSDFMLDYETGKKEGR